MRHEQAVAVVFHATPFTDQTGFEEGQAKVFGNTSGDLRVIRVGLPLAPAVELDICDGEIAVFINYQNRSGIAAPEIVGRNVPKLDAGRELFAR